MRISKNIKTDSYGIQFFFSHILKKKKKRIIHSYYFQVNTCYIQACPNPSETRPTRRTRSESIRNRLTRLFRWSAAGFLPLETDSGGSVSVSIPQNLKKLNRPEKNPYSGEKNSRIRRKKPRFRPKNPNSGDISRRSGEILTGSGEISSNPMRLPPDLAKSHRL